jgi:hypothetical protein
LRGMISDIGNAAINEAHSLSNQNWIPYFVVTGILIIGFAGSMYYFWYNINQIVINSQNFISPVIASAHVFNEYTRDFKNMRLKWVRNWTRVTNWQNWPISPMHYLNYWWLQFFRQFSNFNNVFKKDKKE